MKTSIPRIKTVTPKKFEMSELRKFAGDSVNTAFNKGTVCGFALVTFNKDGSYHAAYHTSYMGSNIVDLPDLVRNRLLIEIARS